MKLDRTIFYAINVHAFPTNLLLYRIPYIFNTPRLYNGNYSIKQREILFFRNTRIIERLFDKIFLTLGYTIHNQLQDDKIYRKECSKKYIAIHS